MNHKSGFIIHIHNPTEGNIPQLLHIMCGKNRNWDDKNQSATECYLDMARESIGFSINLMKLISYEILIPFSITIAGYRIFAARVCDVQIIFLNTLF